MESYRDFSRIYDMLIQEDICYEDIASFILEYTENKNRYLDLGCGTGTLSMLIARHFQETDVQSPYKLKEILGNHDFVYTTEDLVYTWENFLDDDTVEMSLNFFIQNGDLYERIEEFHMERAYESDLLVSMLNSAGFKSIELYDNYSKNKPMQTTERWTIIARKRE